ncbi:MAG TPA: hypothetical protein PLN11_10490 [Ottowia sp.]|nr:hypothetical protein [Ottowia sp.]
MEITKTVNMRLGISGTLVFANDQGETVGEMHMSGSAALAGDESAIHTPGAAAPELTTEQHHGTDH